MSLLSFDDLASSGIEKVVVAGVDMQGRPFGTRMPVSVFEDIHAEGIGVSSCVFSWDYAQANEGLALDYTGAHTGWHDFRLVPDLGTLRRASWLGKSALCLADCVDATTRLPVEVSPRAILRREIEKFQSAGLVPYAATELEFYLYRGTPHAIRDARFTDLEPTSRSHGDYQLAAANELEPFFGELRRVLLDSDVPVEVAQAEYGLGQWEINLKYGTVLEMADRHIVFKTIVQDLAAAHGLSATFMAKPQTEQFGSSC